MPTVLETQAAELNGKRLKLDAFYTEHKDAHGNYTLTDPQIEEARALNEELAALVVVHEKTRAVSEDAARNKAAMLAAATPPSRGVPYAGDLNPGGIKGHDGARTHATRPDFGTLFVESAGFKNRLGSQPFAVSCPDIEMKTLFATNAGWDPFVTRLPNVALTPQQQPRIVDLFPTGTTTEHSMKFMLETTYTNNATMTLEGGTYGEAALGLTEQTVPVQKIAVFLPITDEQLADVPASRDYVNNRLELMLRQKLDGQLLVGDDAAPNLVGLNSVTGAQTRVQGGTDAAVDTALKALTDVQVNGFADPSAYAMHPTDWMNIRLLRTVDGLYIWGHPSAPGPTTLWGLPVVTSTYVTLGSGYVADFAAYFMLFYRKGIDFLVSNSHVDWFVQGKQAIRADMRCALVCFRGKAVCKFTGI